MWSTARRVRRPPRGRRPTEYRPKALHTPMRSETSDARRRSRRWRPAARHVRARPDGLSWRRCAHELQATESDRTGIRHLEAGIRQHRPDVRQVDMTVAMEMREDPGCGPWTGRCYAHHM